MKPASTALQNLLASRQFFAADLYTFALIGGSALRYCSGDRDITAGGHLFTAQGPRIDRKDNKAKCHWKIGVEVDTLVFDVMPQAADMVGGLPSSPRACKARSTAPNCNWSAPSWRPMATPRSAL